MNRLVKLARSSVAELLKADTDAAIGRTPTNEVNPQAGPGVPSEIPGDVTGLEPAPPTPEDIILDAIKVLERGLEKGALDSAERNEISSAVKFLRKGDIPISVKALIKDDHGRTFVLRDAESPYWDLPGGHVQEGESIEDALSREVHEETGMQVKGCRQTDTRMLKLGDEDRPVLFYEAEVEGDPRCSVEHIGYQWAGDEDLNGLNLGVFKDILIPGPNDETTLETGDPASVRRSQGPEQIPHYQSKEGDGGGGIAGPGNPTTSDQTHTPAVGGPKPRRRLKSLTTGPEYRKFLKNFAMKARAVRKVGTGGGYFVTGEETEQPAPVEHKEQRAVGDEITTKEREAKYLDSAKEIGGIKLIKALPKALVVDTDMRIVNKAAGGPFVIAGYASPVVVDQEGHKITREALEDALPKFMADDGKYANVNIMHSNVTVGRVIPEFTTSKGETYKTMVDDIGLFAVAEIRTDPAAPEIVDKVRTDIERGKIRSFSISGNADNPVFMCDDQQCFYSIDKVDFFEFTVCEEGVNQDAKFDIINKQQVKKNLEKSNCPQPPGPPPRPGLVWSPETCRWIRPEEQTAPKTPNNVRETQDNWDQKLERVGGQRGSNKGGVFRDRETGEQSYIKWPGEARARMEVLAADLYEAAGVKIPKVSLINMDNDVAVKSDWLKGSREMSFDDQANSSDVRKNFAVDAWLANWDIVGLEADNVVDVNGEAYRIDTGGSLLFRAMGGPKPFPSKVGELETMRDPDMAHEAAYVFGDITDEELQYGAQAVANVSDEAIDEIVDKSGLPDGPINGYPAANNIKEFLKEQLKNRRDYIARTIL